MKIRGLIVIFGICCCMIAQPQAPTPSVGKGAQSHQQKAAPEIKKTNADGIPYTEADAILDGVPFKQTGAEQQHSAHDWIKKAIPRWTYKWGPVVSAIVVAFFTGILTVVAVLQWRIYRRQADLMETGLVATKEAAAAAKLSAETAERALKLCEVAELQIIEMAFPDFFKPEESAFAFTFKNFGRTVATDVVSKAGFSDDTKPNIYAARATIAAGETRRFSVPFPADDVIRVKYGEIRLNATIATTYNDIFGSKQNIEFLGTYSHERAQFEWMCSKHRMQKE